MTEPLQERRPAETLGEVLNFGLDRLDPSWLSSWGYTIKSPDIRGVIEATPRLAGRIRDQIFREVHSIILDDRNDRVQQPKLDENIIKLFFSVPGQDLLKKVGLAWHANTLKMHLNGEQARGLLDVLGQDAIRFALSYQSVAPRFDYNFTAEETVARIKFDGLSVILEWVKYFPNSIAIPMAVVIPRPTNEVETLPSSFSEPAINLVNKVLQSGGQPLQH